MLTLPFIYSVFNKDENMKTKHQQILNYQTKMTMLAPKVTPPIYFHENHKNTALKLLDSESFQIQNIIFLYNHYHWQCIFIKNKQKLVYQAHKNLNQQKQLTFSQ